MSGRAGQLIADHLGRKEKVVVVHDDEVAGFPNLGDSGGEQGVCLVVGKPIGVRSWDCGGGIEPKQIVEQRPQGWMSA